MIYDPDDPWEHAGNPAAQLADTIAAVVARLTAIGLSVVTALLCPRVLWRSLTEELQQARGVRIAPLPLATVTVRAARQRA